MRLPVWQDFIAAQNFLFMARLSLCAESNLLHTRMLVARSPLRGLGSFRTKVEEVYPKVYPGAPVQQRICLPAENVTFVYSVNREGASPFCGYSDGNPHVPEQPI